MAVVNKISLSKDSEKPPRKLKDVGIWIDNYDDMFSDFDPRTYAERNISEDFLYELKRISQEAGSHVSHIKILIPGKNKIAKEEEIINKRLHDHFKENYHLIQDKVKGVRYKAILFIIIAIIMMVCASYVSSLHSNNIFIHIVFVIIEPAGWFLMWTGFENLISIEKQKLPDLNFYGKMEKSKIVFEKIRS